jgi:hypothetical protein
MRYYDSEFAPPLSQAHDVDVPTSAMEQLHLEEKKVPAGSDSVRVSHAVDVQADDEQPVGPMAEFEIAAAMMSKVDDFETAAEREQRKRREQ